MRRWSWAGLGALVLAAVAMVRVGEVRVFEHRDTRTGATIDLSEYSAEPPRSSLRVLFIHHSCGGQLLADPGDESGDNCIYEAHPNGGGLRSSLEQAGYVMHEASYGSVVGDRTDLFDWVPKFKSHMDRIIRTKRQDELLPEGQRNDIVAFKSCFPNSDFAGEGQPPGAPAGPEHTVANAQATMRALLPVLRGEPRVLFVYVTAPPLAPRLRALPAWRWVVQRVLGRLITEEQLGQSARRARAFNDWVKSPEGWLAGYELRNIVVFDYFDVLSGHGESDLLRYPTGDGFDSHPASEGNARAAAELVPFLNRAARRAGIAGIVE